jgi:predicted site-specific integrase-resolvase
MKKGPTWLHEKQAAEKIGYKPETLRKYVKKGRLNVAFTNLNGRRFQYCEEDLDKLLLENSTYIHENHNR